MTQFVELQEECVQLGLAFYKKNIFKLHKAVQQN